MNLALAADALPAPEPGAAPSRTSLAHCLLLAALLHLWLVALVGTAPGRSAPGSDMPWGAIQIRLGGSGPADSTGRSDDVLPGAGLAGRAAEPRFGGTVREAQPLPLPEPGAADLGPRSPQPAPALLHSLPAPALQRIDPAPAPAAPAVLAQPEPRAAGRQDDPVRPTPAAPAVPEPVQKPLPEAAQAPYTAPRLSPVDSAEAPVLDRPPEALRDIAQPMPQVRPGLRERPTPAPRRDDGMQPAAESMESPLRQLPFDPPLPALAAPIQTVRPPPVPTPLSTSPLTPPPTALPVSPETPAPPPDERLPPPPAPAPLQRVDPLPLRTLDALDLPRGGPSLLAPPVLGGVESVALPAAVPSASLLTVPAPPQAPAPSKVARGLPDRAGTPAPPASAAPLNLSLPIGRDALAGAGQPRVLNLQLPAGTRKSTLAEAIAKSAKSDCRKAYSGLGLLAVVPLAVDAAREGGCRW